MRSLLVLYLSMALTASFCLSSLRATNTEGDAAAGQELHQKFCTRCHGEQGKGDGKAARLLKEKPGDWSDGKAMSQHTDGELFELIKMGGAASGRSKLMPAFESKLKDEQISDLVAFIRSLQEP